MTKIDQDTGKKKVVELLEKYRILFHDGKLFGPQSNYKQFME
jgi:hypothetical protein